MKEKENTEFLLDKEKNDLNLTEIKNHSKISNEDQQLKKSFVSTCSYASFSEGENSKIMHNFIENLYTLQKENKSEDELMKYIYDSLLQINPVITEIFDENSNTFAHMLTFDEDLSLLKIICDSYYINLPNKNDFFDWFLFENNEEKTILDIASIKCNKEILEYLYYILIRTDENRLKFHIKRNTIFHYSAKYDKYYSILFWYDKLQKFFPYLKIIDLCNKYDSTPLHYACYNGSLQCVELLLELNADINAVDIEGKTVLIYAVHSGDINIIKKLLINGADKTIKDNSGNSAYDYAVGMNKKHIALLLKEYSFCEKIKNNLQNFIKCKKNKENIQISKNLRYDFEFFFCLLLEFIFVVIFLLRFFGVVNYKLLLSSYIIEFGIRAFLLGGLFLIITFVLSIYFMLCIKYKQHITKNKKNMLAIYDINKNICVKCVRPKKIETVHCLICDLCIDDWERHCYFLNTCITKNLKKKFLVFIFCIFSLLICNLVFSLCFLIYFYFEQEINIKREFVINFFSNFDYQKNNFNEIWIYLFWFTFGIYFLVFFILFTKNISYVFDLMCKKKNNQNYNFQMPNLEIGDDISNNDKKINLIRNDLCAGDNKIFQVSRSDEQSF